MKKMDSLVGSCDSYVLIEYNSMSVQSSTINDNLNPVWEEELHIPVSIPTVNDKITCKILDKDDVKSNEMIGSFSFSIQDIINQKYNFPFWNNVYGTVGTADEKTALIMNTYPELGSEWTGRIQMFITAEKVPNPVLKRIKMDMNHPMKDLAKLSRYYTFEFKTDIHYGLYLPDKKGQKYCIKVKWGECKLKS